VEETKDTITELSHLDNPWREWGGVVDSIRMDPITTTTTEEIRRPRIHSQDHHSLDHCHPFRSSLHHLRIGPLLESSSNTYRVVMMMTPREIFDSKFENIGEEVIARTIPRT
jgi:hypothetical protein